MVLTLNKEPDELVNTTGLYDLPQVLLNILNKVNRITRTKVKNGNLLRISSLTVLFVVLCKVVLNTFAPKCKHQIGIYQAALSYVLFVIPQNVFLNF